MNPVVFRHLAVAASVASVGVFGAFACSSDPPATTPDASVADASTDAFADTGLPQDGGPDGEAGAWTPAALPHLVLWLDSTIGMDTDADAGDAWVTKWRDQSGQANHATPPPGGDAPAVGVMAGKPTVRFSKTRLEIADAPSLRFGTNDFTIAVVGRHSTPTNVGVGYGFFLTKQEAAAPFVGPALLGNDAAGNSVIMFQARINDGQIKSTATGLNANQPLLMVVTRRTEGANRFVDLRIDGATVATGTGAPFAVDMSAPGRAITLGDSPAGTQSLRGEIAEVVGMGDTVSTADLGRLESYLKAKYGL